MTEDRLLKLLSVALRILAKSKEGVRLPLRKRERAVLEELLDVIPMKREWLRGEPDSFKTNFCVLASFANWEVSHRHKNPLPKLHESIRAYLEKREPGEETVTYLVALLSGIKRRVEQEGLYLIFWKPER